MPVFLMKRNMNFCRKLALLLMVPIVVVFVPPLRNNLIPVWPRAWRPVSTLRIIKLQFDVVNGDQAALSPCTEPGYKQLGSHNSRHVTAIESSACSQPVICKGKSYVPNVLGFEHGNSPIPGSATIDKDDQRHTFRQLSHTDGKAMYKKAWTWVNRSKERLERFSNFLPQLSLKENAQLIDTWMALDKTCKQHNISYFLTDGTLLGVMRHGGIIPWDTDIDVAVHVSDKVKLRRVLSCVPGYTLRVHSNMHWKFFAEDSKVVDVKPTPGVLHAKVLSETQKEDYVLEFQDETNVVMRYPFVDIFLVNNDDSYVWGMTHYVSSHDMFRTQDIYPLTVALFEGYLAPVPRHSRKILRECFDANMCASPSYNHYKGHTFSEIKTIPCKELAEMYTVYNV